MLFVSHKHKSYINIGCIVQTKLKTRIWNNEIRLEWPVVEYNVFYGYRKHISSVTKPLKLYMCMLYISALTPQNILHRLVSVHSSIEFVSRLTACPVYRMVMNEDERIECLCFEDHSVANFCPDRSAICMIYETLVPLHPSPLPPPKPLIPLMGFRHPIQWTLPLMLVLHGWYATLQSSHGHSRQWSKRMTAPCLPPVPVSWRSVGAQYQL